MSLGEEEIKLPTYDDRTKHWIDDSGCSWARELDFIQIEILGLCGCGDPDAVASMVRDAVKTRSDALRQSRSDGRSALRELETKLFGDENTVVRDFVYYRLDNLKLVEHGTSITSGWLTKRGENVLMHLDRLLVDDEES